MFGLEVKEILELKKKFSREKIHFFAEKKITFLFLSLSTYSGVQIDSQGYFSPSNDSLSSTFA
jgi:hypothetical protein